MLEDTFSLMRNILVVILAGNCDLAKKCFIKCVMEAELPKVETVCKANET